MNDDARIFHMNVSKADNGMSNHNENIQKDIIIQGDCIEVMRRMEADSVHAIITDPPYGLEFMGEDWDTPKLMTTRDPRKDSSMGRKNDPFIGVKVDKYMAGSTYQEWTRKWATEALRVLKPGGTLFSLGGTRTYHRLASGIEDAGFTIKDCLLWCYNSGFPKAQDLGKILDKRKGEKRERLGTKYELLGHSRKHKGDLYHRDRDRKWIDNPDAEAHYVSLPATKAAKEWDGWKVGGLKPSYEPIVWAVKPPEGSWTDNVLNQGVGAVNVDECRIPFGEDSYSYPKGCGGAHGSGTIYGTAKDDMRKMPYESHKQGRFPSNQIRTDRFNDGYDKFYFVPKASRAERDAGLDGMPDTKNKIAYGNRVCKKCGKHELQSDEFLRCVCDSPEWEGGRKEGVKNVHPTVKPIVLMEHLIKLVSREGQVVLDSFCGSGTTLIAAKRLRREFIGIDNNADYVEIAKKRVGAVPDSLEAFA